MLSLLPTRRLADDEPAEDRDDEEEEEEEEAGAVVGLRDESAVFSVLSSDVAREMLLALYEEPAVASELATEVGTSLQNAEYHLGKLVDAGVVEVVGTRYSSKGREMTVYGPAGAPLTLVVGDGEAVASCREAVTGSGVD